MKQHKPDMLPPLFVEIPADAYGVESTFVQESKPESADVAHRAFFMCQIAIARKSARIENAYPAHIGGVEQYFALQALATQCGVTLHFPSATIK